MRLFVECLLFLNVCTSDWFGNKKRGWLKKNKWSCVHRGTNSHFLNVFSIFLTFLGLGLKFNQNLMMIEVVHRQFSIVELSQ